MELQPASQDIWATKYQLKSKTGTVVDKTVQDSFRRVAHALAACEKEPKYWEEQFFQAMNTGAIPAGRIMSNVGAQEHKPNASTINCTVSSTLIDSMHGILSGVYEGGITLAAGCGIGYDFSTLRPKGAYVAGVGAKTSGALSFMDIYDTMCGTVASAGGRRGAQMGTMDIRHPDIEEFIVAKRQDGRLRQFNLSVLITDEFMDAVTSGGNWALLFPLNAKEDQDVEQCMAHWPGKGYVKCRIYKWVKAIDLWNSIMDSNYNFAEPGFILIDKYNEMNNNWFCEDIRATNPCGEQGLPPYGSCLLGSINLTSFVVRPFEEQAYFDYDHFATVVRVFSRMLDNVVELNNLPLKQQRDEIFRKRRHGMGYFGLGSAMTMLDITYGSPESLVFTDSVTKALAINGLIAGMELGKEKGTAPIFAEGFTVTDEMRKRNRHSNFPSGHVTTGFQLWLQSGYMQMIRKEAPDVFEQIRRAGKMRYTHHSSIAPTGTISLSFGNNCSNGIEPSFSHEYTRNVIREGKKTKEAMKVQSYESLLFESIKGEPANFAADTVAGGITPEAHIAVQAAAQKWIDSSISKTVNVPSDISFEDFKCVYLEGYGKGCKGVSTFRFNPTAFQGVLVTKSDLEATTYRFILEDGSTVELKGNEEVSYDGEVHSAANLYDALKEKTYGRH